YKVAYNTSYKTHAPDIMRTLEIKAAIGSDIKKSAKAVKALRRALHNKISTTQKGQYDIVITLSERTSDDIVERNSQATRKRLHIKAIITARHTRPPHIVKARTRLVDAAYSDRRDELANISSVETLRQNLVAQISEDVVRTLIYLSEGIYLNEEGAAHGTKESR
ncbi:MAG: hypothetical protein HAW65_03105, partial [Alphaproteobacteria bacterium]|nr:hypothetical protein [Alphaproteobacteria bacterium]